MQHGMWAQRAAERLCRPNLPDAQAKLDQRTMPANAHSQCDRTPSPMGLAERSSVSSLAYGRNSLPSACARTDPISQLLKSSSCNAPRNSHRAVVLQSVERDRQSLEQRAAVQPRAECCCSLFAE